MTVDPYDVHQAVVTYLRGLFPERRVHDGDVIDPVLDEVGRVEPYIVLWFAPGTDPDQPLTGPADALHRLSITAAGTTVPAALWAAGRTIDALPGHRLVTDLIDVTFRWPLGYTPPPVTPDRDVSPARMFVPLLFDAHATTAL